LSASFLSGKEKLVIALFVGLNVVVPLLTTELYPFTRAPMFADAPQHYCVYEIYDPPGNRLSEIDFGVQRNYWGNPIGVGVGFRPPPTVDEFGGVAELDAVSAAIAQHLSRFPELAYVDVVQKVIGPTDQDTIGTVATQRWRVDNPQKSS
jgi:hypothetical protein